MMIPETNLFDNSGRVQPLHFLTDEDFGRRPTGTEVTEFREHPNEAVGVERPGTEEYDLFRQTTEEREDGAAVFNDHRSRSENLTNEDIPQAILNDDYAGIDFVIPDTEVKLKSGECQSFTTNSYLAHHYQDPPSIYVEEQRNSSDFKISIN